MWLRPLQTTHVCQTIPRDVLEGTYGINIIRPREDEDPDRIPNYEELLMAYGCETINPVLIQYSTVYNN